MVIRIKRIIVFTVIFLLIFTSIVFSYPVPTYSLLNVFQVPKILTSVYFDDNSDSDIIISYDSNLQLIEDSETNTLSCTPFTCCNAGGDKWGKYGEDCVCYADCSCASNWCCCQCAWNGCDDELCIQCLNNGDCPSFSCSGTTTTTTIQPGYCDVGGPCQWFHSSQGECCVNVQGCWIGQPCQPGVVFRSYAPCNAGGMLSCSTSKCGSGNEPCCVYGSDLCSGCDVDCPTGYTRCQGGQGAVLVEGRCDSCNNPYWDFCCPEITTTTTRTTTRTTTSTTTKSTTTTRTTTRTTTSTTIFCQTSITAQCSCPNEIHDLQKDVTSGFMYDCYSNPQYTVVCNDDLGNPITQNLRNCNTQVNINVDVDCYGQPGHKATRVMYIVWNNLVPSYEYLTQVDFNYDFDPSNTAKFKIEAYSNGKWIYICDENGELGRSCSNGPFNMMQYWNEDELDQAVVRVLFVKDGYNWENPSQVPSNYNVCFGTLGGIKRSDIKCHGYPKCAFIKVGYCPQYVINGTVYWTFLPNSYSRVSIPKNPPYLEVQNIYDGTINCGNFIYCNHFYPTFDIEPNVFYSIYSSVQYPYGPDRNIGITGEINTPVQNCDTITKVICKTPTTPPVITTTIPIPVTSTVTTTKTTTTTFVTTTTTVTTPPTTTTTLGYCTYTPGGWGTDCPNSNPCSQTDHPGCLRDCYWNQVFSESPHSFVVGNSTVSGGYTVTFTVAPSPYYGRHVADFLPSPSEGSPRCFDYDQNWINPIGDVHTGQFIDNLVAAKLNLLYSDAGVTPPGLGDLIINFQGQNMKIRDFIHLAEQMISCKENGSCCFDHDTIVAASEMCNYINNNYPCGNFVTGATTPISKTLVREPFKGIINWLRNLFKI